MMAVSILKVCLIITIMIIGTCMGGDPQLEALIDFYNATDGDNWKKNQYWASNQDPCGTQKGNSAWQGLVCSGKYVAEMHLSNNGLGGTIPSSLSNLVYLDTLDLTGNMLLGTIPESVLSMGTFSELYLGSNKLQGNLPEFSLNNTGLQYLDLSVNNFHGTIPTSYANLTGLYSLDLSSNALTGTIPAVLESLSLNSLYLNFDGLSGTFPLALCQKLSICDAIGNPHLMCASMNCQCGYMGTCNCNSFCTSDGDCNGGLCTKCTNNACQQQQ